MALQVVTQKREFIIAAKNKKDNKILPDPHPDMTIAEVINHYKPKYPQIASATLTGPKLEEKKAVYTFKTTMGDKG